MREQEIRHMPASRPGHAGLQQERLRGDRRHVAVEVGQQQPGQLQAALIDHVPAHRRGPEIARIVGLAAGAAGLAPRHRGDDLAGLHQPQRQAGLAAISHAQRHHRIRRRLSSRPDASHGIYPANRDAIT
jgi:hypothetical protein